MLPRIYSEEFVAIWEEMYNNWYNKFSAKNKNDGAYRGKDYFEDWFSIWQGPHCTYGLDELVPDVTLMYGSKCDPQFISPKEFLEKFEFTDHNPFTSKPVTTENRYFAELQKIKQKIRQNAEA